MRRLLTITLAATVFCFACEGDKKASPTASTAATAGAKAGGSAKAAATGKSKDPKQWPGNKKSAHDGGQFKLEYENKKVKETYAIKTVLTRFGSNGFIVDMLSSDAKCGDPVRTCNDCSFRLSMNIKKKGSKVTDYKPTDNLIEEITFPAVSGGINEMVQNLKHSMTDKRPNAKAFKTLKFTKIDEAAGTVEGEIEIDSDWFGTKLKGGGKFKGKLCK